MRGERAEIAFAHCPVGLLCFLFARYSIQTPERTEQDIALGWEDIKDLSKGIVTKTFMDDTLPGGPFERTVEYHAPFIKRDREKDYAQAWEFFSTNELTT